MTQKEVIHILRNPYGKSQETIREARLRAADLLEEWAKSYRDVLEWAKKNGLDIIFYG